jgi:hypothetical protein
MTVKLKASVFEAAALERLEELDYEIRRRCQLFESVAKSPVPWSA